MAIVQNTPDGMSYPKKGPATSSVRDSKRSLSNPEKGTKRKAENLGLEEKEGDEGIVDDMPATSSSLAISSLHSMAGLINASDDKTTVNFFEAKKTRKEKSKAGKNTTLKDDKLDAHVPPGTRATRKAKEKEVDTANLGREDGDEDPPTREAATSPKRKSLDVVPSSSPLTDLGASP